MPLPTGSRLGAYEIVGPLGAGAMGEVYRALDSSLGREVAIKVLPEEYAEQPDLLARFQREARLLASLTHPNIAVVHGLEREHDRFYFVMELVRGETLAERTRRGPIPMREALQIFRQIADGLETAHGENIIHRDLKPSNVMITPQGVVKILDFGLAKALSSRLGAFSGSSGAAASGGSSMTMTGVVVGTPAYMSPEQARGDPVDRRTDIWAFGCLLFETITGERAFPGRTATDTIAAILREEPDWSKTAPLAPLHLQLLIRRCLQKDPQSRLRDIGDARLEIDDATRELDNLGSSTLRAGAHLTAAAPPRRMRWSRTVAALLTVLGLGGAMAWWASRPSPADAPLARVMITLPAVQTLERGRFPPIALSPDGKLLAYAAAIDGGRTRLFVRPLDELAARPIPDTDGATTPFFSPDGRWLAFYADGQLRRVSVAGGVPLTICDAPPLWSASWGASDTIVFATTLPGSGLWRVSANGGEPEQVTTPEGADAHAYPQLLPDGRLALFSIRRGSAWHLARLDLSDRTWRVLGNNRVIGQGAQYLPTGHLVYEQSGGLVATPFDAVNGDLDQPPMPMLEQVETSRFGGAYFALASQAGTLVYMPAGAEVTGRTLLRVDREGRIEPVVEARAGYADPAFSPDGRQVVVTIAADGGSDIWIIDLERATRVRLTAGGTSAFPVWAPDGSRVAFQSSAPGPWNLFSKPLNSAADPQPLLTVAPGAGAWPNSGASLLPGTLPTLSGAGPQFPTSWAPDGSTVAFHERKPSGERDIWMVSPGSEPVPFLLTPFDERTPRFSPEGNWVAYVSDESGRNEVYVQPFPGPGEKWVVSTDGGIDPVWSKDGRELFYRQGDQLMAVPIARVPAFSAGRPRTLFAIPFDAGDNGPNYDVSRDGRWFVMPRSDQPRPPGELHLVLNWFSEVTARARPASAGIAEEGRFLLSSLWRRGR